MNFINFFMPLLAVCFSLPAGASSLGALIAKGQYEEAEELLKRSNPAKADILFLQAMKAKHAEDYKTAARLLHQTITEDPNHLPARRQLAHVFLLDERYNLAERNFNALIEIDPDPKMRAIYPQVLKKIERQKPFGLSGYFSFVPSTNLNRGSDKLIYDSVAGKFVIDPNSRAQSGVGIKTGINGFYRHTIDSRSRNILSWGLAGNFYKNNDFNSIASNVKLTHERLLSPKTKLGLGVHYRYNWREDDADNQGYGLSLSVLHALSSQDRVALNALYDVRDFFHRDYNDGPFYNIGLSYRHAQSAALVYTLKADFSVSEPEAKHNAYQGYKLSAGVHKAWDGGLITGLEIFGGERGYDAVFPLSHAPRKDRFYGLTVSISHNNFDIKGFVPSISCTYQDITSNISFYDYDVSECDLKITKRF